MIDIGDDASIIVRAAEIYKYCRPKTNLPLSEVATNDDLPDDLGEAVQEMDQVLDEITTLPADEKEKVLKRLYFRWHPNDDAEPRGSNQVEAFNYLKSKMAEIEDTSGNSLSSSFHSWGSQASSRRVVFSRSFLIYSQPQIRAPDKDESTRWFKQAQSDHAAARTALQSFSSQVIMTSHSF